MNGPGESGILLTRSIENATSSAVKSEPSWNLTPLRSLNSQVVGFTAFQDSAIAGISRESASSVISLSKMCSAMLLFGKRLTKCGSIEVTSAPMPIWISWALAPIAKLAARATRVRRRVLDMLVPGEVWRG